LENKAENDDKADDWEEALVEFVEKWTNSDEKPKFMDVAFNTGRYLY